CGRLRWGNGRLFSRWILSHRRRRGEWQAVEERSAYPGLYAAARDAVHRRFADLLQRTIGGDCRAARQEADWVGRGSAPGAAQERSGAVLARPAVARHRRPTGLHGCPFGGLLSGPHRTRLAALPG